MEQEKKQIIAPWLLIILIAVVILGVGFFTWNYFQAKKVETAVTTNTVTPKTKTETPVAQKMPVLTPSTDTNSKKPIINTGDNTNNTNNTNTPAPAPASGGYDMNTAYLTNPPESASSPKIVEFLAADNDSDGYLDAIIVKFNTFMNQDIISTNGFTVDGYTISSATGKWANTGTYQYPDARAEAAEFIISMNEKSTLDTSATPSAAYKASDGQLKSITGVSLVDAKIKSKDSANAVLTSVVAMDENNQVGIQSGDKVVFNFSEPVEFLKSSDYKTAGTLSASNIDLAFILNMDQGYGTHTWLDGNKKYGSAVFSNENKTLIITLSTDNGVPTVAPGDTIDFVAGNNSDIVLFSEAGNGISFSGKITGSF